MALRSTMSKGLGAAVVFFAIVGRAIGEIAYTVSPDVSARTLQVIVTVDHVSDMVQFQIPTWSPGSYGLGNYAASISNVSIKRHSDNAFLTVTRPDKLTWEVSTGGKGPIVIQYTVNNADLQIEGSVPKRGHISGPRTYMYVVGRKNEPVELNVNVPQNWKIVTSLDPKRAPINDTNSGQRTWSFTSRNYDVLADAPIEMGDYAEDDFIVWDRPHKIVLYGDYSKIDREKLKDYCRRVAEVETSFFGDAPFSRYVFMFRSAGGSGRGGGGLEHLGSTEIGIRRLLDDRVRSVIAHEYFHLWNVKRIRPFVLGPFDYTGPVRTNNLWWAEGITSYYGDLLSRRSGINTDEEYFKHLAQTIGLLQNNPSRLKVTAEEASWKVWDGTDFSQGFDGLSYYVKGELIGLCLDLKIRQVTNGKKSLDDVMKALYRQCGKGNGPGFAEDDIRKTVNQIAGKDLSEFYDLLARTTQEMPFEECIGYAGLKLEKSDKIEAKPVTGMSSRPDADFKALEVRGVTVGGPAETAGIRVGDKIVAIDGKETLREGPSLRDAKPGSRLRMTIERDGNRKELVLTVGTLLAGIWMIKPDAAATSTQTSLRAAWLIGR